jgi:hypothetical protein
MKTIRNTSVKLYALILLLTAVSCQNNFLDTKIDTSLTDKNVESDNRAIFRFAVAPYAYLNAVNNGFSTVDNNLFAVVADEAVKTSTGFSESDVFTQGLITPYINPDDVYSICYTGIRAANYFLENFQDYKETLAANRDTISDNAAAYHLDVADIGFYMAEAHIIRAYYYYELIKRYGGVPLVKNALTINDNLDIPRAQVSEIVDYIVSEVDQNKPLLQASWKVYDQSKDGRINTATAMAIKLRALMLYASPLHNPNNEVVRWEKAAAAAKEIIALNKYTLDKTYSTMFFSDNTVKSGEVIWALRLGPTNTFEISNYPIGTPGGHNEITPSQNLVAAYEYQKAEDPTSPYINRDPRLAQSIVTNNSTWTGRPIEIWAGGVDDPTLKNASRTGYFLKKFLNDKLDLIKNKSLQRSWIIFRYGEILLDYAEAMNEAYGPDQKNGGSLSARDAVKLIRNRADVLMPAVVATNQSEMRDRIKHERRIELAFEGFRYWDLIRWKDAESVLNGKISGIVPTNLGNSQFTYTEKTLENRVFYANKMYFYPIPQSEISKSNGILLQNPGW